MEDPETPTSSTMVKKMSKGSQERQRMQPAANPLDSAPVGTVWERVAALERAESERGIGSGSTWPSSKAARFQGALLTPNLLTPLLLVSFPETTKSELSSAMNSTVGGEIGSLLGVSGTRSVLSDAREDKEEQVRWLGRLQASCFHVLNLRAAATFALLQP
eukprot:scaffold1659_cov255-Pinguiococcus_pyrenoidosus.AAC.28